jgi:DNA-binding transcriptional ArsR family regulator
MNMIEEIQTDLQMYDAQVQILKALNHPARIAILDILRDGEHCVCHIEAYLGLRQAYISQQLSVLREADLIQDRRDGWNIYYRVVNPQIYEVLDAVQKLSGGVSLILKKAGVNCSCPHCSEKAAII